MKLHEVMEATGLTKKAVNYYIEQGLIKPSVDEENNYRHFSDEDVIRLKQISALREFNMPVCDIKNALRSSESFHKALTDYYCRIKTQIANLKQCESIMDVCLSEMETASPDIKKVTDDMMLLKNSIAMTEKEREDFIVRELQRIFPGAFGKVISLRLSYFFNGVKLDSSEKENAWMNIIKKLDESPNLIFDKEIENIIESKNIDWEKAQKIYTDRMEKFQEKSIDKVIENMWDIENIHLSDEEIKCCEVMLNFLTKEENIKILNEIMRGISGSLAVLNPKYEKYQMTIKVIEDAAKEKFLDMQNKANNLESSLELINFPETNFLGIEYKRMLNFKEVSVLVDDFREKIKQNKCFVNCDEIYVIKGIDSLPQYKHEDDGFKFNFSVIIAAKAYSENTVLNDMKVFKIPSHSFVRYNTKINLNFKDMMDDEIPVINMAAKKYSIAKFPILACYSPGKPYIQNYMPVDL